MTHGFAGEVIWIIGASSGIGHALAQRLAAGGAVLALSARRREEIEALAASLGVSHKAFALDVTDAALCERTAMAIRAAFGRIDRIIFLAAVYAPMKLSELDMAVTRQMIEVNLLGAFHVVQACLPLLKEQGKGQLALCGSVAGYVGLPGGQPYSATKAGIISLAESLRAELPASIDIRLISPGFVRTALTEKNPFDMPMIISAPQAAEYIAAGLLGRNFEIHFPRRFTLWLKFLRLLPYTPALTITRTFNR